MILTLLVLAALFLAWSNGANDNFKGVATLYGSATTSFRGALIWATAATAAGSLASLVLASSLVQRFSGKGLISAEVLSVRLLLAVGAAAAGTIFLATRLGMPTSTTHALAGALVGAGLAAAGESQVGWWTLATDFGQPLLLSPVLAVGLTAMLYVPLRGLRRSLGVAKELCVCVEGGESLRVVGGAAALEAAGDGRLALRIGEAADCVERYSGAVCGVRSQALVDVVHYASGGAVCFARAVNDTPKVVALLLGATVMGQTLSLAALASVALAMTLGGWIQSRRVAETMSKHITRLSPGQGLAANLMTAGLVLGASRLGVPVSTTHVSCGAIFGIGLVNGRREWKTIVQILATWVTTLPLALGIGFLLYLLLSP